MPVDSGRLRHRVELQSQSHAQKPVTGEITTTWVTEHTVWASIEPLSAREFMESAANQSEISARIMIRYNPDVTAAWRVRHGSKVYNIHGVLSDKDSGLEYLTLPVSVGVNDGS